MHPKTKKKINQNVDDHLIFDQEAYCVFHRLARRWTDFLPVRKKIVYPVHLMFQDDYSRYAWLSAVSYAAETYNMLVQQGHPKDYCATVLPVAVEYKGKIRTALNYNALEDLE